MVDPVTLAIVTSAVTQFSTEFSKGMIGEAGKSTWKKLCSILGWDHESPPAADKLPASVATTLANAPEKVTEVQEELSQNPATGIAGQVIVHAKNIGIMNNYGTAYQNFQ
jgi:hypothetical protein